MITEESLKVMSTADFETLRDLILSENDRRRNVIREKAKKQFESREPKFELPDLIPVPERLVDERGCLMNPMELKSRFGFKSDSAPEGLEALSEAKSLWSMQSHYYIMATSLADASLPAFNLREHINEYRKSLIKLNEFLC